jgi:xanthine dehydrogenase small subunit
MRDANPSNEAIEKALQGNLCRCTGYEAIMRAARAISSYGKAESDPLRREREAITARLKALDTGARVEVGSGRKRLVVPADVDDFAAVLEAEPAATVVAGSTDVGLWVTKQMRDISPVVFIGNLAGLRTITHRDGELEIGAGVTYSEALSTLSRHVPPLGRLVERIGGEQVRNMGTIGGNIANGSPIGDTPPPLIALDAHVVLRRGKDRREVKLREFFIAYGKQDRQPGEFVERVIVPYLPVGEKFACYKVTKRKDEDISALCGAFRVFVNDDGVVGMVRIAFGGMAATPKRAKAVEEALIGKPWTSATIEAAIPAFATDFQPLTDMRASKEYRVLAAQNLLRRFHLETTGSVERLSKAVA